MKMLFYSLHLNLAAVGHEIMSPLLETLLWFSVALGKDHQTHRLRGLWLSLPDLLQPRWPRWHFPLRACVYPVSSFWKFPWLFAPWPFVLKVSASV